MRSAYEYRQTNREKAQRATKKHYWCRYCDAQLVSQGAKCSNCGQRAYGKKKKRIKL